MSATSLAGERPVEDERGGRAELCEVDDQETLSTFGLIRRRKVLSKRCLLGAQLSVSIGKELALNTGWTAQHALISQPSELWPELEMFLLAQITTSADSCGL